jgi:hypothetical protein
MTTATQRLRAIQELCKAQGKPTHGQAFLNAAERLNESLRGKGTAAYQEVRRIIERGRQYANFTRP